MHFTLKSQNFRTGIFQFQALTNKYFSCPYTWTVLIVKLDRCSLFKVATYLRFLFKWPCSNEVWNAEQNITWALFKVFYLKFDDYIRQT